MRAFALLVLFAACEKTNIEPPPAASSAAPALSASFILVDAAPLAVIDAAPTREVFDPTPWLKAGPVSGKSVGHTSVVFRLELDGPRTAAFKPESKRGHQRYRGEIASYRVGKALGIDNVPPVVPRTFDQAALDKAVSQDARAKQLFFEEVVAHTGRVSGSLSPWIPKLEILPIENDTWKARWKKWLTKDGEIPEDQKWIAAQISKLLLFDALTGNWDRWSGANVGVDRARNLLLFIDNDGSFFDPVPAQPLEAQIALITKCNKLSRSFVAAFRALDALKLADAIGDEVPGTPLLPPRVIAAADSRRMRVIQILDQKVRDLGDAVFAFE